jgi:hypothetical protein
MPSSAGSFTSPNGFSVTIVANGSGHVARLPEASFGKSVPVSVARSLSSGHLNLSHPTGSCAKAGAALTPSADKTNIGFTGRSFWSRMILSENRVALFGDHALIDCDHDIGCFDDRDCRTAIF